ncbi:hypothetical protein QJS10_CPB11g00165 [Acorus calamus]|uniref:G domain-containing protein n=1 Tax=Acorus calamus TaxID=4465 RepID=A0AAV9DSA2_ACOCL|nr:hypothetical protein QJS10_CPB11g00165 [Acorus calamus]
MSYFEEQNCVCLRVNSHNKNSMEKLLNFIQAHTRRMTVDKLNHTTTVMLVGIPNVGKSAIATNLHQIGRIKAVEKGKLKHAVVSSVPGETKDINSFKIASHPNIYVLDTPGILAPKYLDVEKSSKLALTGVIKDSLLNGYEIAQCFLAILNSGDKYKSWMNLMTFVDKSSARHKESLLNRSDVSKRRKQFPTDHTQDFIVRDVRRALYDSISSFKGNLGSEKDMIRLIETQFLALHEAFRIPLESGEDGCSRVALKLLNLYRIGRLGHYTLDSVPRVPHGPID